MANRNYQTHALCLFASVVEIQGFSPSISNQTPVFIHTTYIVAPSLSWNRDVLLYRRFVSGAFAQCRWNYRLSIGDCPLTQWYGSFTWVFDPGINGGINLLDRIRIRNRIGYVSRTQLGLSFIFGILVICARFGAEYSCIERAHGYHVMLTLSDDVDVFPLPWMEFFNSSIDGMGCEVYGSTIKVIILSDDDDGDYFPWSEVLAEEKR
ncbi:hypothetical protein ARALYDRAFT_916682 [Arabidopsis lyrata subsp. lyrata]|uniref:Uncharacterized protein n=1 Tax=Arabidopsis lyrata subsp. lyrata TaxID=81972 RepID=D7MPW8_ARALL|nr:hypothetical protein ARALYDRAFT_916682 [Arabidopsis lyrata subsp. lyrata]